MLETKINDYGKDKLKNLASYKDFEHYPIIYQWHDLHQIEPTRKFILYFAIPDDRGNTFVIPSKWCEDITNIGDNFQLVFELNDSALDQLSKVGVFSSEFSYPIINTWESINPKEPNKKKFDVFYAILNEELKVFIIQSTWGILRMYDENDKLMYVKE
jgi:hypothetical protein